MAFSLEAYTAAVLKLMLRGRAWNRAPGSDNYGLAKGIAQELVRIDASVDQLLAEADPRKTTLMLPDWEGVCGLPDPCRTTTSSIEQRRKDVIARLTSKPNLSSAFYIAYALSLGYTVTIYKFRAFRAGMSSAGDPCCDMTWMWNWKVTAPLNTVQYFSAGQNSAGDPLAAWENGPLECSIKKLKPAESVVQFAYS